MNRGGLLVFYDGWCPLCTKAKKTIQKHDHLERIQFLSFREKDVMDHYNLWDKNVEERLYAKQIQGVGTYSGIAAVYEIVKKVPAFRIFVPLIFISIKMGMGQRLYDYIARRRKIIPVGQCEDDHCQI